MARTLSRAAAKRCRTCAAPILLIREVDSTHVLVLNRDPAPGGTVVLLGDRAQVVPAGGGPPLHTIHVCRRSSW